MSVLAELRQLTPPDRALQPREARSIAEKQARRFRQLTGYDDTPMLPNSALLDLPRIHLVMAKSMNHAGLSGWDHESRRFQIVINGTDAPVRQRFTLAHEYKHIVDYTTYKSNYETFGGYSAHDQSEDACDYFAGCLLIPRHLLKRAWTEGVQNTRELSQYFGSSKAAVRVRLRQTGLVGARRHDWFTRQTASPIPSLQSVENTDAEVRVA